MAEDVDNEEWRPIKDWPAYEVSSMGRVRRVLRGRGTKAETLKLQIGKRGYPMVMLRMMPRCQKIVVHRLVCEAFHGAAPFEGAVVAHWDGSRTNNVAENLRWTTQKDNLQDAKRHGTWRRARKHSEARVRAIKRARVLGLSYSQLSRRFGVNQSTVAAIIQGKIREID